MDKEAILNRVLKRIPLEDAMDIIKEKFENWTPAKKPRKKDDIRGKFVSIANIIREEEIEDFVQMAVMKKVVGLPAYTYKMNNSDFLKDIDRNEFAKSYEIANQPYNDIFTITSELLSFSDEEIEMNFRLKEYEASWKTGVRNIDSLSAVFTSKLTINRNKNIVTIFCGNHNVQDVLKNYIGTILKWPVIPYRINENVNQLIYIGSVSYKSAILLDLINNRLKSRGIDSTFKEMKFFMGSKIRKDGIKDVAIGGKALLSSKLACQYITLGSHVIYFKAEMNYGGSEFTAKVYLKGTDFDILKIVILDTENDDLKSEAVRIIQEEYIDMCNIGIKDLPETKNLISTIADRFINEDKLLNRAVKDNILKVINSVSNLLPELDENNQYINENLKSFTESSKVILDSIGYNEEDSNLELLNHFIQFDDLRVIDNDDYEEIVDDID